MPARLIGDLTAVFKKPVNVLSEFVHQLKACRECGEPAGFFDGICGYCGAANPVKIPVSASVMVTAVAAQLAIVFLRVM